MLDQCKGKAKYMEEEGQGRAETTSKTLEIRAGKVKGEIWSVSESFCLWLFWVKAYSHPGTL